LVQREELKAMDDRVVTGILAGVGLFAPPYTAVQLETIAAQLTELEWMTVVGRKALNTYADDRYARHRWMRLTAETRAKQRRAGLEARRGVCQCCGQPLPAPKRKKKR
jgi:RNA polymerase-binding transcription factor DksA